MLLLLACNLDSAIQSNDPPKASFDSGDPIGEPTDTSTAGEDPCNGVDDNGNGVVDDGAPDADADGIADCIDDACTLDSTPGGAIPTTDTCGDAWVPPNNPWDVVVEWSMLDLKETETLPVVGQLSDDDGDGDIDSDDVPDIVLVDTWLTLNVYAGDGSGLILSVPNADGPSPALVDVDHDGVLNILYSGSKGLCALQPDGTELWCQTQYAPNSYSTIAVVDLDADGNAEIVVPEALLDAATGTKLATVCEDGFTDAWTADLDGDGVAEIFCGSEAWDAAGTKLWEVWSASVNGNAIVDEGLDGLLEVVVARASAASDPGFGLVSAETGAELHSLSLKATGAPCVADFNGDGIAEIGQPTDITFDVYNLDLTLVWSAPAFEAGGYASCAAYDFDADGAYEIVYADTTTISIFDGATGDVNYSWTDHTSTTRLEYPTVVDVDGDGSVEIVASQSTVGSGTPNGIVVLGHATGGWPASDPLWSQSSFDATLLDPTGAIYADRPEPPVAGGYAHARPPGIYADGGWVLGGNPRQLSVQLEDACSASCEAGNMDVALTVANAGEAEAEALVELYTLDYTGEHLLASTTLTVGAGTRAEPLTFTIAVADVLDDGLLARVSQTSGDADCDPTDDEDQLNDLPCR